jgi:8-amino-7-oxononanoate synthase
MQSFIERLTEQKNQHLWRERVPLDQRLQAHWQCSDQRYLSFMNNDYLGLASDPEIIAALRNAALQYGVGSSASPLLGGYYKIHQLLEQDIADFIGFERGLVFSTGYLANLAVVQTLIGQHDAVFEHRLNHASLIDATRTTGATIKRFRNTEQLAKQLSSATAKKKWIISDAVFSMDGLIAPIPEYINLAKKYQAYLILDDAHGVGVLGAHGAGSLDYYGACASDVTILTGTFGKAFGGQGAFVLGNALIIEYLIQFSRSYRYSTALSPALAAANHASLQHITKQSKHRTQLQALIVFFTELARIKKINFQPSETPIQILLLHDAKKTLEVMWQLKKQGILVGAIRPPTVAMNQSRLRINLSALHSEKNIVHLLDTLQALL